MSDHYFSVTLFQIQKKKYDIYVYDTESNLAFRPYSKVKLKELDEKLEDVLQHFNSNGWQAAHLYAEDNDDEWKEHILQLRDRIFGG